MKNKKITLIIATYNWIEALELTLLSVLTQTKMPLEVIIADDGSTYKTKELIDSFREKFKIPLIHIWHNDEGFRLAEIRNKAIVKAKGQFICQIDGDIILHPKFIEDYSNIIKPDYYYRGSRVRLDKELSGKLIKNKKIKIHLFTKGLLSRFNSFRCSVLHYLMSKPRKEYRNALGCNMGFWKKNLIKINGYSNDMTGWGHEDEELCARLINIGILKKRIKHKAIVYHIYHEERSSSESDNHNSMIENVKKEKIIITNNGINELS